MYEGNEKVLGKERVLVSAASQMVAKLRVISEANETSASHSTEAGQK